MDIMFLYVFLHNDEVLAIIELESHAVPLNSWVVKIEHLSPIRIYIAM